MKKRITYSQVGDDYNTKDPIKKLAQMAAEKTARNFPPEFSEITATRGESAFVWKQGRVFMASVIEGVGTRSLVADAMYQLTRKSYYDIIAYDTIATIINDLITVGAKPLVLHAYWAIEDNSWLADRRRMQDFIKGWKKACDIAGVVWGGGETPTLKGIIQTDTIDVAGSAVGIISSKKQLLTDQRLQVGDCIVLLKSNGMNANGVSLARAIAKKLPKGYKTKLSDGMTFGDGILAKTNIYAKLIQDLFVNSIDLHYISNIIGHGLRKIMRGRPNFTYSIEKILIPQEVFLFIQKHANLSDFEMYQTYNMGMDFALYLPEKHVKKCLQVIKENGFLGVLAGYIEKGEKQVIIKPKNLVYKGSTLDLRN